MGIPEVFITTSLHILVYCVGACVLFHQRIRNIRFGILILALCIAGHFLLKLSISDLLYVNISAIVVFAILVEGTLRQRVLIVIKNVFIISCSIGIMEEILEITGTQFFKVKITPEQSFLLSSILLLLIMLIVGRLRQNSIAMSKRMPHSVMMIVLGLMAASLVSIIASLSYAEPYVNNKRFSIISGILIIVSYLGIVVLGLFILYTRKANENYSHLLETEYLLRKLQKEHYEIMLDREEETRAFRHDLFHHILCLKEFIKSGNPEKADCYMNQMQIKLLEIQKKCYTSGNEIIDAILNYYVCRLGKEVEVRVTGLCNRELDVSHAELCSIVSNPLQNAVEALIRQQQGQKYLNIHMNSTETNVQIQICNSFDIHETAKDNTKGAAEDAETLQGIPKSKKEDKRNHGIGLKNVKTLVEKNNGLFQIDIRQGQFKVILILPVKSAATEEAG